MAMSFAITLSQRPCLRTTDQIMSPRQPSKPCHKGPFLASKFNPLDTKPVFIQSCLNPMSQRQQICSTTIESRPISDQLNSIVSRHLIIPHCQFLHFSRLWAQKQINFHLSNQPEVLGDNFAVYLLNIWGVAIVKIVLSTMLRSSCFCVYLILPFCHCNIAILVLSKPVSNIL